MAKIIYDGDERDPVKAYLSEIGRKGGSKKTPAQTEARRKNALKGGRPRKGKACSRCGVEWAKHTPCR